MIFINIKFLGVSIFIVCILCVYCACIPSNILEDFRGL